MASQGSVMGKAQSTATLLPWQNDALCSLLLCCAYTQPHPTLLLTALLLKKEEKNHSKSDSATKHEAAKELIL